MEITSLGQVVADRSIRNQAGDIAYVVKIGIPQQFPDSTDFYRPIQVSIPTGESQKIWYSAGIDSVQALQLAMKLVGGLLFRLNEQNGGRLRWDGDENGDLGFPIPD